MWWAGINLGFLSWEKLGRFFISWILGVFYSMGTIYYGEGLGGGGGGGGASPNPWLADEEADCRMLLHAHHAAHHGHQG